jgi:hypothetical protein
MKHLLEQQSDIIDATLARHGIPARVTGGTVAPRRIRYDIGPLGPWRRPWPQRWESPPSGWSAAAGRWWP